MAHAEALDRPDCMASAAVEWGNVKPIGIQHHNASFDRHEDLPPKKLGDARCD